VDQKKKSIDAILQSLNERAKELNCLYEVDEALKNFETPRQEVMAKLVNRIPPGWQYPDVCCARIHLDGEVHVSQDFKESPWVMSANITARGDVIGSIDVYYTEPRPAADSGPFLKEEERLLRAIADRIGMFIMQKQIHRAHNSLQSAIESIDSQGRREWGVILDFLSRIDPGLLIRVTRKMINHLCWTAVDEAEALLSEFTSKGLEVTVEENRPLEKSAVQDFSGLTQRTFEIATQHLGEAEVVTCIQAWIEEEKSAFLINALENPHSTLPEIVEAVDRFRNAEAQEHELPKSLREGLRVALLRRLFIDDLSFINVAKKHVEVGDFYNLLDHVIFTPNSHGHLGGKSAGLFVASQLLRRSPELGDLAKAFKVPNTWYVSSDCIQSFIRYNDLEDLHNRKYLEIERVRQEYPHIIHVFKNSQFPPDISKGLAVALDDFEDRPLVVRSSSLLEDQLGSAFSGKYKSLFLANQGTKRERLEALQDAIAEVYASIFAPDPIEYRAQRGLLDFHEEMGIMIQEVVGKRVGHYFLPAYAGVAFGNNEFRWSPRIKREDGVVRLVPGLGTRAVDRLSDDYPVLISPGQPGLRVNVSADEIAWYSPNKIDVINLDTNRFETLPVSDFIKEVGLDYPALKQVVSVVDDQRVRRPTGLGPDFEKDRIVVTFDGLVEGTDFVKNVHNMLSVLRAKMGFAPDIEFASDGDSLYLLQCRTQSYTEQYAPAPIPKDIPADHLLFSANRYISNGRVPDVTHVVYVDPDAYAAIETVDELRAVGEAIGRLNILLPKRRFVLIGPGRWGSRGDIRLGVHVTYSDINRSAVLLEVARKKGNYLPELSFGTHFFQDLVEADIRYIPLYPDEKNNVFNEAFLMQSYNALPDILPRRAKLASVIRVIDVPRVTDGRVLRILMNADLDKAVGVLAQPSEEADISYNIVSERPRTDDDHWRWRMRMAERLAEDLDAERFDVKGLYVFGSTKNATAGPGSDIDLLVHVGAAEGARNELALWLDGWSRALAEMNYWRTGYQSAGLLDVHYVTDADIANRTSYAVKIGAVTDEARPLPTGKKH